MNDNGTLKFQFLKDQSNILEFQVQPVIFPEKIFIVLSLRYFCKFANGRRTVGYCSHIINRKFHDQLNTYQHCLNQTK